MWKLMNAILLSCREATRIAAEKAFRKLGLREKVQLKMHKTVCHYCRKFDEQNEFIDLAVHRHIEKNQNNPNVSLPEDHKVKIQAIINQSISK